MLGAARVPALHRTQLLRRSTPLWSSALRRAIRSSSARLYKED